MNLILKSFKLSLSAIFNDPVNIVLAIVPTLISLSLYILGIVLIFSHSDTFYSFFRNNIHTSEAAGLFTKMLTVFLVIFIFFIMNWTFVLVVGLVSSPFNSLLSHRIEQKMVSKMTMDENQKHAMIKMRGTLFETLKNELKKIIFLSLITLLIFVFNFLPFFYPIGVSLVSLLLAVQFLDYSWSRHQWSFLDCLKDIARNFFSYILCGGIFLSLISIPLVNAFVSPLATSFFTVFWLSRLKTFQFD